MDAASFDYLPFFLGMEKLVVSTTNIIQDMYQSRESPVIAEALRNKISSRYSI